MIQSLILDFGGTIVTMPPDAPSACRLAAEFGIPCERVMPELLEHPDWKLALCGAIDAAEFDRRVHVRFGVAYDPTRPRALHRLFADETLSTDLLALADGLRRSGTSVAVLSNADDDLEERILRDKFGILDRFDLVVNSSRERLVKPDPAIYALTLQRLGVTAEQAIFVDDIPANVQAAARLGIHAIHFQDEEQAVEAIQRCLLLST
jgi:epoxide hydrolase-like predicted phosphatase